MDGEAARDAVTKGVCVIGLIAAFVAGMWVCGFFAQDACLNAGGSWDNQRNLCLVIDEQTVLGTHGPQYGPYRGP